MAHLTESCLVLAEFIDDASIALARAQTEAINAKMADDEIIQGIQDPGKFDANVGSEADALRVVRKALPHAMELPPAVAGQPYPLPPPGVKTWFQVHPAEPGVANDWPHVKYADWSKGKKGRRGSWGHVFFPPPPGS